ncbi:S-adenosyl-L-methionine-dependent methyltransferase [Epithele typhae]|uniref:S-adenosyl-L-methionine-dependent methyltransferase n=1 Tax=Epithele typhae TaxID=378194 RepID=UPI002007351D|nr:S-adenosyl-L-methionine-dependent methyltransferase [Epithele typhae]KAH9945424.1 S-adenosyl-L-methionine-dependent methyltransferase [Epithele typhae]
MSTFATLRALHATLGAALDEVESVYAANGELRKDPKVAVALSVISAACGHLNAYVRNPFMCAFEEAMGFLEGSNVVEILREAGPNGLHVNDIASKIDYIRAGAAKGAEIKPIDTTWVAHLLRMLAVHHGIREVRPDVFANNRFSSLLDTGKTVEQLHDAREKKYEDTNGFAALIPMMSLITHAIASSTEDHKSITSIVEWLLSPSADTWKYKSPFNYAYETEELFYAWLQRPENGHNLAIASRAMAAGGAVEGGNIADTSAFPWDTLPSSSLVIDVGGGIGGVAARIAAAHPHLRVLVQDTPKTVMIAPRILGQQPGVPALLESGRLAFEAADFFASQPSRDDGKPASVFLLSRIMHDYDDENCLKILKHLRAAATPATSLLISEHILPYACADGNVPADDAEIRAPANSPLLPNLGTAYAGAYHADLHMLTVFNGRERTAREFAALTRASGWKIARVHRNAVGLWCYITAVPV